MVTLPIWAIVKVQTETAASRIGKKSGSSSSSTSKTNADRIYM